MSAAHVDRDVPDALFVDLGSGRYRPTELAIGPWDRGALHGGPPSALVAGALETAVAEAGLGVEFLPARFTAELLRPVPLDDLTITATIRRPGRRICLADATLARADGTVVLAATLEGIRRAPFRSGWQSDLTPPGTPADGNGLTAATLDGPVAFHRDGVDHRVIGTTFEQPGPAADWIRLRAPVVAGRSPTPLERVVAAADFGNGISKVFDMEEVLFVNPDLTVHLYRLPVGEWVCLDAVTRMGDDGVGLAESVLFDETGPLGRSTQLLLVEPR